MMLCKMSCHKKCNYHCPYCGKIYNRRTDANTHFRKCEKENKESTEKVSADKLEPSKKTCFEQKKNDETSERKTSFNDGSKNETRGIDEEMTAHKEFVQTSASPVPSPKDTETKGKELHDSIIDCGSTFEDLCTIFQGNKYSCKLCQKNFLIPRVKERSHQNLHMKNFIVCGTKHILLCKQQCRKHGHCHCRFCGHTFLTKKDAEKHIGKCEFKRNKSEQKDGTERTHQKHDTKRSNRLSGLYSSRKARIERKRTKCLTCKKRVFFHGT